MTAREYFKGYEWARLAEKLGVASVICGAVLWGTWQGLAWIGAEIIKPLVAQNVETSAVLREQIPTQTAILRAVSESTTRQEQMHSSDQEARRADHEVLQAIGKQLERICTQHAPVTTRDPNRGG